MGRGDELREKIVRTREGIQYSVLTDEPWHISGSDVGELIRTDQSIAESIHTVVMSVRYGLQGTGVTSARVQFGLSLSGSGAFFVTKGQSDAHIVVSVDVQPEERSSHAL
ncbi:CU044_2847 family protein [Microbispora sitophila]|uniref:CU044_2847 family protein n=1 Tax=Microbispora sitophila TaxID=2771537 RepID=UPI001D0162A9